MANFMALVYGTLRGAGIDTSSMSKEEAIKKFKDLQSKDINNEGAKASIGKASSEQSNNEEIKVFDQNNIKVGIFGGIVEGKERYDKNLKERNEFFSNSFNKMEKELGEEKINKTYNAISKYTHGFDSKINNYLRNNQFTNDTSEKEKPLIKEYIESIKEGVGKFDTPMKMRVFSNRNAGRWVDSNGFTNSNWEDLIGKEFTEKSFVSSSLDKSIAKEFFDNREAETGEPQMLFEIDVPKGKGIGMPIWKHGEYEREQEYLLNANHKFKILDTWKEENKRILKVELIKN